MAAPSISVTRILAVLLFAGCLQAGASDTASFDAERRALMREIERAVRQTAEYLNRRRLDERVMTAMASVPRHEFVRPEDRDLAYANRPLPIGYGQTISQPYIVAVMTDLVEPAKGCRALEVGTGSGYQAAPFDVIVVTAAPTSGPRTRSISGPRRTTGHTSRTSSAGPC